ncbi:unnamed protein product [Parnassius apollo]|uniref:(apollo) hypothetical protein n=1 Tax=Parnassius apollo TaxID=110799 RepID=A0A8S3YA22_PARAO|nr:unnamed protein product [Parnassius apollo]
MKLFERIIDTRIRQECTISDFQYVFQPGRSTMDPAFALRILMEKHREKNMPPAFFIPRPSEGLCDLRGNRSVLSPYLFSVILDELSASVQKLPQPWLLMYADDIALVDGDKGRLTRRVHAWREALENGGLKLNVAKTEYMACNSTDLTSLRIGDDTVECTDKFRYLGSVLDASGDIDRDIKARLSAAWAKWREVTSIICNPKMPVKLKGQIYKTIIRPVLNYGSEAWPVLERHWQLLNVTEMNKLRWMCGVTRKQILRTLTFLWVDR